MAVTVASPVFTEGSCALNRLIDDGIVGVFTLRRLLGGFTRPREDGGRGPLGASNVEFKTQLSISICSWMTASKLPVVCVIQSLPLVTVTCVI